MSRVKSVMTCHTCRGCQETLPGVSTRLPGTRETRANVIPAWGEYHHPVSPENMKESSFPRLEICKSHRQMNESHKPLHLDLPNVCLVAHGPLSAWLLSSLGFCLLFYWKCRVSGTSWNGSIFLLSPLLNEWEDGFSPRSLSGHLVYGHDPGCWGAACLVVITVLKQINYSFYTQHLKCQK